MSELRRLMEAAKQGNLEAVKTVLHGHHELLNEKDAKGATALHYAAFGGHRAMPPSLPCSS